jgi:peptide-methionine (S)-S-oxide reductase
MKIFLTICVLCVTFGLVACSQPVQPAANVAAPKVAGPPPDPKNLQTAVFAGGCFWSMQRMMDEVPGVITTTVGYAGGTVPNPTYEEVSSETTGHAESVQVVFDSAQISYAKLLDAYWHDINPTQVDQQFCDRGSSYRSIIFYGNAEQKQLAEASKQALVASGRFSDPIVTEIIAAPTFYRAEEYHQKFYLKNPDHYAAYRAGCGRDASLAKIWGTTQ